MYPDPADVEPPPECEICGGYPNAHDHLCPYNLPEPPNDYDER